MNEQQWESLLVSEESKAWRKIVTLCRAMNDNSGFKTARDVAKLILSMEDTIASTVGDCPE
jgi:hypothetical protein